ALDVEVGVALVAVIDGDAVAAAFLNPIVEVVGGHVESFWESDLHRLTLSLRPGANEGYQLVDFRFQSNSHCLLGVPLRTSASPRFLLLRVFRVLRGFLSSETRR